MKRRLSGSLRSGSQSESEFLAIGPDICIFGLNFPPEPTGIAPYVGALATGLAAAGHDVTVHVAHPHYPKWEVYDGYGAGQGTSSSTVSWCDVCAIMCRGYRAAFIGWFLNLVSVSDSSLRIGVRPESRSRCRHRCFR